MIDAICDICGKQTCEAYELKIQNYSFMPNDGFRYILCRDCTQALTHHIDVCATMYKRQYEEIGTYLKNHKGDETE